jgi:hypothetical protein
VTDVGRDDPVVQSVFDTGASLEAMVRAVRNMGIPRVKIKIGESWGAAEEPNAAPYRTA